MCAEACLHGAEGREREGAEPISSSGESLMCALIIDTKEHVDAWTDESALMKEKEHPQKSRDEHSIRRQMTVLGAFVGEIGGKQSSCSSNFSVLCHCSGVRVLMHHSWL